MALGTKIGTAGANAACDAIVDLLDAGAGAGTVKIYDGTVPATLATALGAQVLLATGTYSDPAFGAASSGTATASAITGESSAPASGTPTFFRAYDSNGVAVLQGTVGTSGTDLVISSATIAAGNAVDFISHTVTMPLQ